MREDIGDVGAFARDAGGGPLDRFARFAVLDRLGRIRDGGNVVADGGKREDLGDPDSELRAEIVVQKPSFYRSGALCS